MGLGMSENGENMMEFVCPTCGKKFPRDLKVIIDHTEHHIIKAIKNNHPEWSVEHGIDQKCYEYYRDQVHPDHTELWGHAGPSGNTPQ